jgi:hypothetical protein
MAINHLHSSSDVQSSCLGHSNRTNGHGQTTVCLPLSVIGNRNHPGGNRESETGSLLDTIGSL